MRPEKQIAQTHKACVQRVQRYIHEHLHESLNREVLADVAGFSIPHFHRIFTAHTGESAISYVRRARLTRAGRKLLMGAVDIMEVAIAAGYGSHTAFSKAFRKHFGISPEDFRRLHYVAATKLLREGATTHHEN